MANFLVRLASENRGDVAFIVRAHDSAFPFLEASGSGQWGEELFSERPAAVEAIQALVRNSEWTTLTHDQHQQHHQQQQQQQHQQHPLVRTYIAELGNCTVEAAASQARLTDYVPSAAASIRAAFPEYISSVERLQRYIAASRATDDFLYLDRLVTDRSFGARSKGAGKVLLRRCKHECRAQGKRVLYTDCFAGPPDGLRHYYQSQGFVVLDTFSVPSKHVKDAYWAPDLSAPLSASFTYDVGGHGWGNEELQLYTDSPRNAFVSSDGQALVIRAVAEIENGMERMTSARLVSRTCLQHERGYVEAHIVAPQAAGIWHAFWLLPRQPFSWPGDGEIDIAEGWNGKPENGTCLHWGHFNGPDHDKHRVLYHPIAPDLGHTYGLCWSPAGLIWFLDGRPTMRACVPPGVRPLSQFQVLLNVAMGGNVMGGVKPSVPSTSEMVVRDLRMCYAPPIGWDGFEQAWASACEGNTM